MGALRAKGDHSHLKKLSLNFRSGRDVLKSYWGYLANGGLVVEARRDLSEGQPIRLDVVIQQSQMAQSVSGRVVRLHPNKEESVVELDPGDSGRLLRVALADAVVDEDAKLWDTDERSVNEAVRLLEVSDTGCCVRVADANAFPVGTEVEVEGPRFRAKGCVVWSVENDRGVMFSTEDDPAALEQLNGYLSTLRQPVS